MNYDDAYPGPRKRLTWGVVVLALVVVVAYVGAVWWWGRG